MESKLIHGSYTDSIKEKIVPSLSDTGKKFVYSNFQKLINKSLGLPSKNDKDSLPIDVLQKLTYRENLVKSLIDEGKSYQEIKDIIETF